MMIEKRTWHTSKKKLAVRLFYNDFQKLINFIQAKTYLKNARKQSKRIKYFKNKSIEMANSLNDMLENK